MKSAFLALLTIAMLPGQTALGRFHDGYKGEDNGVSIGIYEVRGRYEDGNREWAIAWGSRKKCERAEIDVTVAGFDIPVVVAIVPCSNKTPLDLHNPVFRNTQVSTVSLIEFTLRNGNKVVGRALFQ